MFDLIQKRKWRRKKEFDKTSGHPSIHHSMFLIFVFLVRLLSTFSGRERKKDIKTMDIKFENFKLKKIKISEIYLAY